MTIKLIATPQSFRKLSGFLFLGGNIMLITTNIYETNIYQIWASFFYLSASIALVLSANHSRWLFWECFAVGLASLLAIFSNTLNIYSFLSLICALMGSLLVFLAAMQREKHISDENNQGRSIFVTYPLTISGALRGFYSCLLIISAYSNNDTRLMFAAIVWTIAYALLILSDEYLRKRLSF